MARYRMEDNTVVDTDNAKQSWDEKRVSDGRNLVGRSSGSQWKDQSLHESRKGRFYTETESRIDGIRSCCEWVSEEEAVRWLILNDKEVPERLQHLVEQVTE